MSVQSESTKKNVFLQSVSGALTALSITLVLILIFALLIRFTSIPDNTIMPVNQAIKIISLFFGIFFALKKNREKGFVKGLIIGLIYIILAYIVFSLLSGKFAFSPTNIIDVVFAIIIGGLCGIICVNIRRWWFTTCNFAEYFYLWKPSLQKNHIIWI